MKVCFSIINRKANAAVAAKEDTKHDAFSLKSDDLYSLGCGECSCEHSQPMRNHAWVLNVTWQPCRRSVVQYTINVRTEGSSSYNTTNTRKERSTYHARGYWQMGLGSSHTSPTYKPNMTPSDYSLFESIKFQMCSKQYGSDKEVELAGHWNPRVKPTEFYRRASSIP